MEGTPSDTPNQRGLEEKKQRNKIPYSVHHKKKKTGTKYSSKFVATWAETVIDIM